VRVHHRALQALDQLGPPLPPQGGSSGGQACGQVGRHQADRSFWVTKPDGGEQGRDQGLCQASEALILPERFWFHAVPSVLVPVTQYACVPGATLLAHGPKGNQQLQTSPSSSVGAQQCEQPAEAVHNGGLQLGPPTDSAQELAPQPARLTDLKKYILRGPAAVAAVSAEPEVLDSHETNANGGGQQDPPTDSAPALAPQPARWADLTASIPQCPAAAATVSVGPEQGSHETNAATPTLQQECDACDYQSGLPAVEAQRALTDQKFRAVNEGLLRDPLRAVSTYAEPEPASECMRPHCPCPPIPPHPEPTVLERAKFQVREATRCGDGIDFDFETGSIEYMKALVDALRAPIDLQSAPEMP